VESQTPGEGRIARNRRAKRGQIIDAAKEILASEGLAACTARAVADAGPLTKSAIHYYFSDINEIVDLAVLTHVETMLEGLRGQVDRIADPDERRWMVIL
jgi:DNA-binding transcriptional regulator YbjK